MNEQPLTLTQAAAALGLRPTTLHAAIRRGKLVATRQETPRGAIWWVAPEAVEAYRRHSLGKQGWQRKVK